MSTRIPIVGVPVVGVTGPPAAGKSAFARALADRGARVVDVDSLGHRALEAPATVAAVVREFGPAVRASDGSLDRRALAQVVFPDAEHRRRLESLVHPLVRRWIDEEIADARADGAPLIVLDCALLFESGLDAVCDTTVAIDAAEPLRIRRAREAHGWDASELARRTAAQLPAAEKRARAGRTIENDGNLARLADEAAALLQDIARGFASAPDRRAS